MTDAATFGRDQFAFWNGEGGARWVAQQAHLDAMFASITARGIEAADARAGERAIDIGCGCGTTTLALSDRVGPEGHVTGLDISAPMLAVARERATGRPNVTWQEADAASASFEADTDLLFSRFGVMFFGDPAAAFANLRRALKPAGRLVFVCWRSLDENPWMKVPLEAAYEHVPKLPPLEPGEPGPFSFADDAHVQGILNAAGFANARMMPFDLDLDIAGGGGIERAARQAVEIGAASRALRDHPQSARDAVARTLHARLLPYARGASVMLPGAVWIVSAEP